MKKIHALLLINPVSGTGKAGHRTKQIVDLAEKLGWKGDVKETTQKKGADKIAKEALRKGIQRIIVCGGDGTIMQVLEAVAGTNIQLGIIPLGTGNLFARNLGIPLVIDEAMEVALRGIPQQIDVGKANGKFFSVIAGIGLDAQTMRYAKRRLKDTFGMIAYVVSALKNITKRRGKYRITIDGEKIITRKAKSIMVANMGRIQGGIELVPRAHPQNGVLRVGVIKARDLLSWLDIIFHTSLGKIHKSTQYELIKGKHIVIESLRGPQIYQCDGNDFPATKRLEVIIYPKCVVVLTAQEKL